MARRSSRARVSRGTNRRKLVWGRANFTTTLGAGAVARTNLLAPLEAALGSQIFGSTIVRIRGVIATESATAYLYRVGVLVDNQNVAAPDIADGPFGAEGQHQDWMLFEPFTGSPAVTDTDTNARVIDVKSMRKLDEVGSELQLWQQNFSGSGGAVTARIDLSVLVMLP